MKYMFTVVMAGMICISLMPSAGRAANERNIVPNGSFEEPAEQTGVIPEGWGYLTSKESNLIGTYKKEFRSGNQCVRIESQNAPNAYEGLKYETPVKPDSQYTFSSYLKECRESPIKGGTRGMMVIEWYDDQNNKISREVGPEWKGNLSRMRWRNYAMKRQKVPEGATKGVFGIHLIEDAPGEGAFLVDDVEILERD
jgi:hypothetical protein